MAISKKANNIEVKTEGTKLTLTIDLSKEIGESKSGKNVLVASSKGNQDVGNGLILGLNLYRPVE